MLANIKKDIALSIFLLCAAFIAIQKDNASMAGIQQPPVSQVVPLNENATFHCVTDDPAQWRINGTILEHGVPDSLRQRGITVDFNRSSSFYNTLVVLGSRENNNTEIMCEEPFSGERSIANLTIAGAPDPPGDFSVAILQYCPTRVQLRWQEPYFPPGHSVLFYAVYINSSSIANNITSLSHDLVLESNIVENCEVNFTVTASNDVAESEPIFPTSILKVPKTLCFEVESEISHHSDDPLIRLHIKFPELCHLQQMSYTVILVDVLEGNMMHLLSKTTGYTDSFVEESIPLHTLPTGRYYNVIVHLETATGNASSCSSYIFYNSSEGTEPPFNGSEGTEPPCNGSQLVFVVGILSILLVICFLMMITIILALLLILHKRDDMIVSYTPLGKSAVKQEAKNPFYECPFYENLEERFNSQSQHVQSNGSEDTTASNVNLYHSIPIDIEGSQNEGGQGTDHTVGASDVNGENVTGVKGDLEGEEEYTIMHTPVGMSSTPTREDIRTWMSTPKATVIEGTGTT